MMEFEFVGKFKVKAENEAEARTKLNKCFRTSKKKLDESGVIYTFMSVETAVPVTKPESPG